MHRLGRSSYGNLLEEEEQEQEQEQEEQEKEEQEQNEEGKEEVLTKVNPDWQS